MPEPAVGLAVALTGALLCGLVSGCVGEGRAAGAAEHAVTNAAVTRRTAISPLPIKQLVPSASPLQGQGPRGWGPPGAGAPDREADAKRRAIALATSSGPTTPRCARLTGAPAPSLVANRGRRPGGRGPRPRSGARSESLLAHSSSDRYNCLASRGHGDAWFRQGRQTDRREPRNAVPPR